MSTVGPIRARLEEELARSPHLARRASRFGHRFAYFAGEREVAHFHADGRLDIRLTRDRIREMKREGSLSPRVRTRGPSAHWVALPMDDEGDLALARDLLDEAVRANAG